MLQLRLEEESNSSQANEILRRQKEIEKEKGKYKRSEKNKIDQIKMGQMWQCIWKHLRGSLQE